MLTEEFIEYLQREQRGAEALLQMTKSRNEQMNSKENYTDGSWRGVLGRGDGFPRGAEFFTSPPYLSCRNLSESQNNFSIV